MKFVAVTDSDCTMIAKHLEQCRPFWQMFSMIKPVSFGLILHFKDKFVFLRASVFQI